MSRPAIQLNTIELSSTEATILWMLLSKIINSTAPVGSGKYISDSMRFEWSTDDMKSIIDIRAKLE